MNRRSLYIKLYLIRFELFFFSLIAVLFGSLLFPFSFGYYESIIAPILFLVNILAGVLLMTKRPKLHRISWGIFFLTVVSVVTERTVTPALGREIASQIKLLTYFFFYVIVTYELILQVWFAREVDIKAILGLMSGYICLGMIAFFIFTTIDYYSPEAFAGLSQDRGKIDDMMYFSFITLLTIGYGEITPVSHLAQKATVLTGLVGQFYLVIIMAVVLEKFMNYNKKRMRKIRRRKN